MTETDAERLLVAEVEPGGARFALVSAATGWAPTHIRHEPVAAHPTFLSALRHYADAHRVALAGHPLALSVAGPVGGPVVACTHGGWFIALRGVEALTGRPPLVVNDASAVAWATVDLARDRLAPVCPPEGGEDAPVKGRHLIVSLEAGLGVACIDRSGGRITILDSEAAHMRWTPATAAEHALAERLDAAGRAVSVEAMLLDGEGDEAVRAGILGAFCRDLALAFAAWDGVLLGGARLPRLLGGDALHAFRARFHAMETGTHFNRRLSAWRFDGRDLILHGVTRCWRHRSGSGRG